MRLGPPTSALLLATLLPACSKQYDNPFANRNAAKPPPAGSDLIFCSNGYGSAGTAPKELFAMEDGGGNATRLTFCNDPDRRCDFVEAAAAPDRQRIVVRRISTDTDGDGRLTAADGVALVYMDLTRAVEATLLPQTVQVSGIDWSTLAEELVYSARGDGGREDLYRIDPNGQNNINLTQTAQVSERRPRFVPRGGAVSVVFERIDSTGKGQIWIYPSNLPQTRVTTGGPGSDPLPRTPYVVGSDADPDYSPDGASVVFRRLTGLGSGLGTWDILTVRTNGTALSVVASGPIYRGEPDWGPGGILFSEIEPASGATRLVVVQPDGSGRRVILAGTGIDLGSPRWLP